MSRKERKSEVEIVMVANKLYLRYIEIEIDCNRICKSYGTKIQ